MQALIRGPSSAARPSASSARVHDRLVEAPEAGAVEEHAVRGPPAPEVFAAGRQALIRPNNVAVRGFGPWRAGSVRGKLRTGCSRAAQSGCCGPEERL